MVLAEGQLGVGAQEGPGAEEESQMDLAFAEVMAKKWETSLHLKNQQD